MSLRPLRELRDTEDADSALAAELARSFPPLDPQLVPPRARARRRRVRSRLSWLAPAFVVLALCVTAVAGVRIGRWLRTLSGLDVTPAPAPSPRRTAPSRSPAPPAVSPPASIHDEPPPAPRPLVRPAPSVPVEVDRPEAERAPPARPSEPKDPSPELPRPATMDAATQEDFALLVVAMKALRSEHDPVRAAELAEHYLVRHPRGALAEDALAIAFEAALARDEATARTRAREYLARFPDGHYAAAALRIVERSIP